MSLAADDVAIYGDALSFAAYGLFAMYLWASSRWRAPDRSAGGAFLAALLASAAWAALALGAQFYADRWLVVAGAAVDLLRYALWFWFLLGLFRASPVARHSRAVRLLRSITTTSLLVAAAMLAWQSLTGNGDELTKAQLTAALALPVCGLLAVEQLFRNQTEESRWNAKPVCLALGCVFAFDVYLFSEALLFGRFDVDALNVRAGAHALQCHSCSLPRVAARTGSCACRSHALRRSIRRRCCWPGHT